MTDLVVAVRLKADGSGLVGQMRLSKEAVDELKQAATQAGGAAESMAADLGQAGAAAEKAGASAERAASAILDMAVANARAERAAKELKDAQVALAAAVEAGSGDQVAAANRVAAAQEGVVQAQGEVARASRKAEQAGIEATRSLGAQRAGYAQLGFQIQDITQSIALGTNAFTILAQQGGQTASAVSQLGLTGVGGRVAAFLAGPWGAAILAATAILGPFAAKLFETSGTAAKLGDNFSRAASASDAYGEAQSALSKIIDLTTGKLKTQNLVLIEQIRLLAEREKIEGAKAERAARKEIEGLRKPTFFQQLEIAGIGLAGVGPGGELNDDRAAQDIAAARRRVQQSNVPLSRVVQGVLDGRLNPSQVREQLDYLQRTGQLADRSADQVLTLREQLLKLPEAIQQQRAAQLAINAIDGKGLAPELRQDAKKKKPKSGAALERFGDSADTRLDSIISRYSDVPSVARDAQQSLIQLDALAKQIEKRKPPNYAALKAQIDDARAAIIGGRDRGLAKEIEAIGDGFDQTGAAAKRAREGTERLATIVRYLNANLKDNPGFAPLIEQAERAKAAIEASVLRPYRELVTSQREQVEANDLILRGREDEAQALQLINGLKRAGLVLTQQQKDAILLGVQATRQQARELDILQRRQQNLLGFASDARGSIVRAFAGESTDIARDIVTAFRRAFAEQLTERLFGNFFRDLTDKILGRSNIKDPAERFKDAVNLTLDPLADLKSAASGAAESLRQVGGGGGNAEASATAFAALLNKGGLSAAATAFAALLPGARRPGIGTTMEGDEVVITSSKTKPTDTSIKSIEQLLSQIVSKGLNILGIDAKAAGRIGDAFGNVVKGAGTGLAIAGLGQALGIGLDSTGAAIGGGIGGILKGIKPLTKALGPLGSVIEPVAGLLGGIFGSLFSSAPRAKSGAITSVDGKVEISGNNGDAKNSVAQAVSQVQAGLQQIADQLGADIGNFSVSIAKYKDSFRVDPTGSGSDGGKYGDRFVQGIGKFDNNDIQGAVSFAIADAIKDGAIKGISPAVAKALQSSTDVNKALREALKVRDLETFIGGPAAALKKTFDDFDRLAAERVELAKKYSLDLVELEKKTGEARAKLVADTLQANTGELQSLLDSIKFGDLFEGTAAEKRRQLGAEIDKAQADQAAGVEGAGAKLAQLYQQLLSNSRDAFGTSGAEYAADRQRAVSGAEAAIKTEKERIDRAAGLQQAAVDAAQQSNTLLDEIASLTATTNGKLDTLIGAVQGGGEGDLSRISITNGDYGNWWDAPQLGLTVRNALV